MKSSPLFSINWKDFGKSILVAGIVTVLAALAMPILNDQSPHLPTWSEFVVMLEAGGAAMVAYLVKQFFTGTGLSDQASKFFSLNFKDLLKATAMTFLTAVLTGIGQAVSTWPPHFPTVPEMVVMLKFAAVTAIGYLINKLMQNSQGQVASKEPPQSQFPNVSKM
jgi:hypothetical protein